MQALDRSRSVEYDFVGSLQGLDGIDLAATALARRFIVASYSRRAGILWQPGAVGVALKRYDALIFLADPHFVSTWLAALAARVRGIPVLFWGHGWLRRDQGLRAKARRLYFSLARNVLVYSERAKRLGADEGFPGDKITVVYNSLDVDEADRIIAGIEDGSLNDVAPHQCFEHPGRPVIICIARLTKRCRFDLLISAAGLLAEQGQPVNVLLVGDGPERQALERQAADLGVALHLYGACYDEVTIGQLTYRADLTVSPGKIGLTAMHSLMYGTPAITHGDLDEQMPEVEAIEPDRTGAFFTRGDPANLAQVMGAWLATQRDRAAVRARARRAIRAKWTPQVQADIIENAVLKAAGRA